MGLSAALANTGQYFGCDYSVVAAQCRANDHVSGRRTGALQIKNGFPRKISPHPVGEKLFVSTNTNTI